MGGKKIALVVGVAVVAVAAVFGARIYLGGNAAKAADEFLAKRVAPFATTQYEHASRSMSGALTMTGMTITPAGTKDEYKIQEVTVHKFDDKNPIPNFAHVTLKGIELKADRYPDPRAQQVMKQLGYDKLSADLEIDYDHKPEAKTFKLSARELVKDAAELEIKLDLGNLALENVLFSYPMTEIKAVQLTYHDHSLIDRALKLASAQSGLSREELVAKINEELDKKLAAANDKLQQQVLGEIKKFIAKPGSLTFSVKPAQPVKIMELAGVSPEIIAERLGVTVTSHD